MDPTTILATVTLAAVAINVADVLLLQPGRLFWRPTGAWGLLLWTWMIGCIVTALAILAQWAPAAWMPWVAAPLVVAQQMSAIVARRLGRTADRRGG